MAEKLVWFQFYPRDWYSDPKLAQASAAVRGIWIDFLSAMFIEGTDSVIGDRYALARLGRCDEDDIDEFIAEAKCYRFADVTECNGRETTYTITSRRFRSESKTRADTRERVRRYRAKSESVTLSDDTVTSTAANSTSVSVSVSNSSSLSDPDPSKELDSLSGSPEVITPDDLRDGWNEHCAPLGLPKVEMLSATRRQKALARLREHKEIEFWNVVFGQIRGSPFLLGHQKTNGDAKHPHWKANFDWLIDNDTNVVKVYEGRYVHE